MKEIILSQKGILTKFPSHEHAGYILHSLKRYHLTQIDRENIRVKSTE